MEPIGSAIYTSMAFLNHSCNPNTIKYWDGKRMVLMATRPIRKGDEVTDNYGMHFTTNGKHLRRKWLQVCEERLKMWQYRSALLQEFFWFECHCLACEKDLPLTEQLPENPTNIICPENKCRLEMKTSGEEWLCQCGKRVGQKQVTALLADHMRKLMETMKMEAMTGDFMMSIKNYSNILKSLYSVAEHPWRGLVMPEQMLWKAIRMVHGNRRYCQWT